MQRHRPGQMQNGAVAAEGDEQIRRADLLMQRGDSQAQLRTVALPLEGQAHHRLKMQGIQQLFGLLAHPQLAIPIGIGAEDHFFHIYSSSVLQLTMRLRHQCR